jgi:hypothetical protein
VPRYCMQYLRSVRHPSMMVRHSVWTHLTGKRFLAAPDRESLCEFRIGTPTAFPQSRREVPTSAIQSLEHTFRWYFGNRDTCRQIVTLHIIPYLPRLGGRAGDVGIHLPNKGLAPSSLFPFRPRAGHDHDRFASLQRPPGKSERLLAYKW